ncbi:hypothetical protein N7495_006229 [Penicillium taxi]|uniref:uncharacterized protein n=1 Tax=Penicillium taxi TaxID=168475 RepID=UPI0025457D17|nr:uncharacterized protein N7495_006229 [Penicillium taxi]KAJ5894538.1 hypothetical protein N7495_006229 [Penicillium taxi]
MSTAQSKDTSQPEDTTESKVTTKLAKPDENSVESRMAWVDSLTDEEYMPQAGKDCSSERAYQVLHQMIFGPGSEDDDEDKDEE